MSEPLLSARGIHKSYRSGPRTIDVLRGLDLDISTSEAVAIVGDSGVGKSTLLHILGGLDRCDEGELLFDGSRLYTGDPGDLADHRNRNIGFIFQFHHLLPEFTALENVEMPFRIGRRDGDHADEARRILTRLGLEERLSHRPGELSGGEQQRVAIARALAVGPRLVLADEPTGNLDPGTGRRVFELLRTLQRERSFALVLASHSERLATGCDRVLRLEEGRLRPLGKAEEREYFSGLGQTEGSDPKI
jgi:lipoprotein-releasing system ATP-binding protein